MRGVLLNAVAYQIAWFACVKLALPWCYIALFMVLFIHFSFTVKAAYLNECLFLAVVTVIGFSVDSLLSIIGVFHFSSGGLMIPEWLLCLWICFATTIRYCLEFLSRHSVIAMLFGAFGGASSYYLGVQLNDTVSLGEPILLNILIVFIVWAVLMPLLLKLAKIFDAV